MSSLKRRTLMLGSKGSAEIRDSVTGDIAPQSGSTFTLPALTAQAAESQTIAAETETSPEIDVLLTNKMIEDLLGQSLQATLEQSLDNEEAMVPSRPAMLDIPPFRASQPALLELAPYDPSQTTAEIQNQRTRIGNKARIAISIGVGVALGLAGTALYSEYQGGQSQKPATVKPVPERNGL